MLIAIAAVGDASTTALQDHRLSWLGMAARLVCGGSGRLRRLVVTALTLAFALGLALVVLGTALGRRTRRSGAAPSGRRRRTSWSGGGSGQTELRG